MSLIPPNLPLKISEYLFNIFMKYLRVLDTSTITKNSMLVVGMLTRPFQHTIILLLETR